jgi:hypothetical protein
LMVSVQGRGRWYRSRLEGEPTTTTGHRKCDERRRSAI